MKDLIKDGIPEYFPIYSLHGVSCTVRECKVDGAMNLHGDRLCSLSFGCFCVCLHFYL